MADLAVETMPGDVVTAAATTDPHGHVAVSIHAPHGSTPGGSIDVAGNVQRIVKITEPTTQGPWVREIPVFISYITVAPGGSNDNQGVLDDPFATVQKAASAAVLGEGDTIALRNLDKPDGGSDGGSEAGTDPGSSLGSDPTPIAVPPKVTIVGVDPGAVTLAMRLDLQGDATLTNLVLTGPRLELNQPGAHVSIKDIQINQGITITTAATGASLDIGDRTKVNAVGGTAGPLLVQADGASVTIAGSNAVLSNSGGAFDTIFFKGAGQKLSISDSALIVNDLKLNAVHIKGSTTFEVMRGVRFITPVTIEGLGSDFGSDATFSGGGVNFASSPLTFQGHNLTIRDATTLSDSPLTFTGNLLNVTDTTFENKGIIVMPLKSAPDLVGDATLTSSTFMGGADVAFGGRDLTIQMASSFSDSIVTFNGRTLSVKDASFVGSRGSIEQGSPGSTSTLYNVDITNYTQWGYHLITGQVAISESRFAHASTVMPSPAGPFALLVDANDTDSSVSSQGTLYDGATFTPMPCKVSGPDADGAVYSIKYSIDIDFCQ
jgi:hypothetical protein